MKLLLPFVSCAALLGILAAASLILAGSIERSASNNILLISTIVWFATAPLWIGRKGDKQG